MDRLTSIEEWILAAVAELGSEAYGVSIRQYLHARSGRLLSLGAVYGSLDRLTRRGLLEDHMGDPTPARGGRRKRYFQLTRSGRSALAEARQREQKIWAQAAGLPRLRTGSR